jgi:hypothetical protein
VAADQRGHAIGVALDTNTESDLESGLEAVTKPELALSTPRLTETATSADPKDDRGFRGKRGKTE